MEPTLKKILKALSLELRHLLEGWYDAGGAWHAGDLEQRLAGLGVWRAREPLPADEFAHLPAADRAAREVVDAYLALRCEAGVSRGDAVAEFVRETAYTWANRLLALRCMEARGLIDEVILQRDAYGGRSLEHHRLIRHCPELAVGEDDGLFSALDAAFVRQAERKLALFDPHAPAVALKPSVAALRRCVALLSGLEPLRGVGAAADEVFQAHDALGWAYQYWNTEEKDRVFEKVRTQKGAKIAGADIIPATQLYTEPYMVKFLVQNSLGALWMGMHPESRLCEKWEYYVRDADRAAVTPKPVREISFLDPATGSGHFHLEAFDLFYDMYLEEGELTDPAEICAAILAHNLYGIDIDERAIQIAEAALWMKAAERAFDFPGVGMNLVATNIRLPKGKDHLQAFLAKHPEDRELRPALEAIFEELEHADELGSLLQIEEPVERELRYLRAKAEAPVEEPEQPFLLPEMEEPRQGRLPLGLESYDEWKARTLARLEAHFSAEAVSSDPRWLFWGRSAQKSVILFSVLARRYDVVVTNPPYLGTKKQGEIMKAFLGLRYPKAQYDLYSAFIVRSRSLLSANGYAALVTRATCFFQKWFTGLRTDALAEGWFSILVPLGTGAFEDFGGDVVDVTLQVLGARPSSRICGILLTHSNNKASDLAAACKDQKFLYRDHSMFEQLPGKIINLELPPTLVSLFTRWPPLSSFAYVTDCVVVVGRYLRYWWECPLVNNDRWRPYSKGGAIERWVGHDLYAIDWQHDGARLKAYVLGRYPPSKFRLIVKEERYIGEPGLTWTTHASGTLAVRVLPQGYIVSSKGPGVFGKPSISQYQLLGLLNTYVASFLMRVLSPGQEFGYKYVAELPIPDLGQDLAARIADIATNCLAAKTRIVESRPSEVTFDPLSIVHGYKSASGLAEMVREIELKRLGHELDLLKTEGILEELSADAFGLSEAETQVVYDNTSLHPWLVTMGPIEGSKVKSIDDEGFILAAYGGPSLSDEGENTQSSSEDGEEDSDDDGTPMEANPLSQDTLLGRLSRELSRHPTYIFAVIQEALATGKISVPSRGRQLADLLSVNVLSLLGHRWPKQIEAGEPVPDWADPDGIIPLTEGTGEPTLYDRVRDRIAADFPGGNVTAIEAEFAEIMGKSLEQWLAADFFKHHTSQFKKRPIAWQIGSGKFTARRRPAFACLVYYHKLDGNTLAAIQSQYVRPLRGRYETELRGIEAIPAAARSERQAARRIELEGWIAELRDFDDKLGRVSTEGFASNVLTNLIAQEPADSWCSIDGIKPRPADRDALHRQEMAYIPDLNDGVRVNIAPLQKAGLLAADVIAGKDVEKAIADRAEWRADERRWCREGKLPRPGWWRGDAGTR